MASFGVSLATWLLCGGLLGRHADRAVEADRLAVEVDVLGDVANQRREFRRLAEARGKGTILPSASCTSWGMPISIGVSMMPGAIVITRMPLRASSRATGRVSATTAPLEQA